MEPIYSDDNLFEAIEVIVLAGGLGTRLAPYTGSQPKILAPIGERPFLDFLLSQLRQFGFRNICLAVGHLAEPIVDYLAERKLQGLDIRISKEDSPLGTGGAARRAMVQSKFTTFLILNGDTIVHSHWPELLLKRSALLMLGLVEVSDGTRYGSVKVNKAGLVVDFDEKLATGKSLVSAGIYYTQVEILSHMPLGNFSMERDLLPKLVRKGMVQGQILQQAQFIDIGTKADYIRAQTWLGMRIKL